MNPTDNQMVRVVLDETDDSGRQQGLKTSGREREQLGSDKHRILRVQAYGLSGHAPKGSQGVVIAIGGNPDQAVLLGGEHPDHRPKDLGEGEVMLYSQFGQKIHLKANGDVDIDAPGTVYIRSGGTVEIN